MAIVGFNGAGKSTILKTLYGLLKPDRGRYAIDGTVHAIIELGTGFDPLLTGRENIQTWARLYSLSKRNRAALHEEVCTFAELDEFIDAPFQSYSSGMKARLAYSLSASLKPDLLLVDEVLAVGDIAFQRKCVTHIRDYLNHGGSVLFVSHNTYQVQAICEEGLFLDRGRIAYSGQAIEALNRMHESARAREHDLQASSSATRAKPIGPVIIESVFAQAVGGEIVTGQPVRIVVRYRAEEAVTATWGFGIWTGDQWICITGDHSSSPDMLSAGAGELTCTIPRLPLLAGRYVIRAAITDPKTLQPLALYGWQDSGADLHVIARANHTSNAQAALRQVMAIDVQWY